VIQARLATAAVEKLTLALCLVPTGLCRPDPSSLFDEVASRNEVTVRRLTQQAGAKAKRRARSEKTHAAEALRLQRERRIYSSVGSADAGVLSAAKGPAVPDMSVKSAATEEHDVLNTSAKQLQHHVDEILETCAPSKEAQKR
jgi:mannitol-specific phosphotransferase system IIBC component